MGSKAKAYAELKWILLVLIASAVLIAFVTDWGLDVQFLCALVLVSGSLAALWLHEKRTGSDRPQGESAVLFGLMANVIAATPDLRLLLLARGAKFDSFETAAFADGFSVLAAVTGAALAIRAIVRARGARKLLGLLGLALSLTPMVFSNLLLGWIADIKDLRDIM